ncbi:MAG: glycerol-3-phosphate 1-O-acyltransferase PlsY [Verrucomicrobia bacterium]|nr:glycerol-3-phosphate 1-O-acyltransferase PlsY [Verrucomicrobiota bacterium]
MAYTAVVVAAYLIGSIPTGFLAAKAKGIDIRTVGSGNIGATNAFRVLGKAAGTFVLAADAFKGWVACRWVPKFIYKMMISPGPTDGALNALAIAGAVAAVLGHNYTCWLNFKGGKGIATSAGVLFALVPLAALVALATWTLLFVSTRFVSVGSLGAAAILPFATFFTTHNLLTTSVTAALSILAIYKHKPNIQRLIAGTENRVGGKKPPPDSTPPSTPPPPA